MPGIERDCPQDLKETHRLSTFRRSRHSSTATAAWRDWARRSGFISTFLFQTTGSFSPLYDTNEKRNGLYRPPGAALMPKRWAP